MTDNTRIPNRPLLDPFEAANQIGWDALLEAVYFRRIEVIEVLDKIRFKKDDIIAIKGEDLEED